MPTYKHILFATDLTEDNNHIIPKVKKLAALYEAKVSAIHVVEHLAAVAYSYVGSMDVEEQLVDEAEKQMKVFAKEMGLAEDECHVEIGHAKTEILNLASQLKADLIIVGSHGRQGITTLIGSTTNAILHGAECDVLTIRAVS